ncbi:YncE family protein [Flavobacterium dankookense]|uniref:YVTN family beta-propeller protein n=1 Tax=Flavobacterium dankookense TaxID=706186 RepID=A0A4R6QB69_9FLAO|nr:DUF5074 domain-containing protein [Flavobacterium dankookense]TDP59450.1 YVTN family beta-propeller protein [Flavobacterium dankookense]
MNFKKLFFAAIIGSSLFTSCTDDDANETPLGNYDNGVLILNQGGFGYGNASLSYFSNDLSTFQNTIFSLVNPTITLGDTAQDIGFYTNLAYIVLNGSSKIEIVNRFTLAHVGTISEGLSNPRYIQFARGKAYVTNWGNGGSTTDDFVAVINLATNTVSSTIAVAEGPERIIEENDKLYVAHSGGFGYGNTISVINAATDALQTTIAVGDVPNSIEEEDGYLYVICGGKPFWTQDETLGKLVKIRLSNNTVTSTISFPEGQHPSNLVIENNSLYYTVDSGIYKKTLSANTLPATELFSISEQSEYDVYSFAVKNNKIFVGDAVDYSSNGKVYVYSLDGDLLANKTVGVIPAGFYFN